MNDDQQSAEFGSLDSRLEAAVQAVLAEPNPEEAVVRVKTRARQLSASVVSSSPTADSRQRSWRIPHSVAANLAIAASLLVVITGVVLILDYSGSRAFAQVIEKVITARSVRFEMSVQILKRPATVSQIYLEGNRVRVEQLDGQMISVADLDRKQSIVLYLPGKLYQRVKVEPDAANILDDFYNPMERFRQIKAHDAKSIGQEILHGRRTQVYRLREGQSESIVWVDVASELPAKIVLRNTDPAQPQDIVIDNIIWNEPFDPQTFSLDVPAGFKSGTIVLTPPESKVNESGAPPAFVDGVLRDRVPSQILWDPTGTTIMAVMRDPESTPILEQQSDELRQWDLTTGKLRWSETIGGTAGAAATPDGKLLATVFNFEVRLRDAATGNIVRTWATDELISALTFSPDGKTLAAGTADWGPPGRGNGDESGGIQIWDVERANLVRSISDDWPTSFVKYSIDGKYLADAGASVKLWDVETGELARVFPGRTAVDFSPDGKTIACPSAAPATDKTVGKVDVYDLMDGSLVRSFTTQKGPSKSWLLCVAFSRDGRLLAATDWNGTVTIWNVETGQRVRTITEHDAGVLSAAFAPNGNMLATGSEDKTLRLWRLSNE